MSAALHLAKPDNLDSLCDLVAAFHQEAGLASDDAHRRGALAPLLDGSPLGAVYLIGPARAPMGYAVLTFTWSVEFGGLAAALDEFYLRPAVRKRGIATEALLSLTKMLTQAGARLFELEADQSNADAMRLYERSGFKPRDHYVALHKPLGHSSL